MLVPVERLLESPPIPLCFHEPGFDLPFLVEVWHPFCDVVVVYHVAEIIQRHVLHLRIITNWEADHIR